MRRAVVFFACASSPQYTRLGRVLFALALNTLKKTSLGTVLKADTTWAFGTRFANSSAPDDVCPTTSAVSSAFTGREHVTTTLPDRSPAFSSTSPTRDQCTARSTASAESAASAG